MLGDSVRVVLWLWAELPLGAAEMEGAQGEALKAELAEALLQEEALPADADIVPGAVL